MGTLVHVSQFQGMEGKYKHCEGIDKEYFPCNVEPCDMQVTISKSHESLSNLFFSVVSMDSM